MQSDGKGMHMVSFEIFWLLGLAGVCGEVMRNEAGQVSLHKSALERSH